MPPVGYGPNAEMLSTEFAAAFDIDGLAVFLAGLGTRIDDVAPEGTMPKRAWDVMHWFAQEREEARLLDALEATRAGNLSLMAAVTRVRRHLTGAAGASAYSSPDPVETCFIRSDWPFFDRADLRHALRALSVGDAPRTLVIRGGPRSGRSYAGHVATHVAEKSDHGVYHLNVSALSPGFRAEDLATPIVLRLGRAAARAHMPDRDREPRPTAARFNLDLASWLVAEIDEAGRTWWILIDGFDKVDVHPDTADFVAHLMRTAEMSSQHLRVVLLGCADVLPPDVEELSYLETIGEVGAWTFDDFFRKLADHMEIDADDDAIADAVHEVLGAVPDDAPDRLSALNQQVRVVARAFIEAPEDAP